MNTHARLLTALAYAVLVVLCATGTGQANPFTYGYAEVVGSKTLGPTNAIAHIKLVIPADSLPVMLVGVGVKCKNDDATPTGAPPLKAAVYSPDWTTVLDTTEALGITTAAQTWRALNFTSHYWIADADTYEIAFWGGVDGAEATSLDCDSTAGTTGRDTTHVMTSQTYGNAWPTLTDGVLLIGSGASDTTEGFHINCYVIVMTAGTAAIVGTNQTDDTRLASGAADKNYGAVTSIPITANDNQLIRFINIDGNVGAGQVIDSAALWMHPAAAFGSGYVDDYRVFKWGWGEGTVTSSLGSDVSDNSATWNDWACDDSEWTTAGCNSADDGGSDNRGDATGADRTATLMDSALVSTGAWSRWRITTSVVQGWYDGSIALGGLLLKASAGSPSLNVSMRASEYSSSAGQWPVLQIFSSAVSSAVVGGKRKKVMTCQ